MAAGRLDGNIAKEVAQEKYTSRRLNKNSFVGNCFNNEERQTVRINYNKNYGRQTIGSCFNNIYGRQIVGDVSALGTDAINAHLNPIRSWKQMQLY